MRNRGFTLVELLVAIVILGVLMSVAFGSLRLGSKSLNAGVGRADQTEEMRATADFLRRQFAQLTPERRRQDNDEFLLFDGDTTRVNFVTPSPAATLGPGLMRAALVIEQADDGVELWVAAAPYDPGQPMAGISRATTKTLLVGELASARIRYFGVPGDEGEPEWFDRWDASAARYPLAVQIETVTATAQPVKRRHVLRIRTGNGQ